MKRVSIKDIANEVGVSYAAVSMVLSHKNLNRISKETQTKILETAKRLNYQPNILAKSLKSGRSRAIGLVVAEISNEFFSSLASYIQEEIEKAGYAVIIVNTNEDPAKMEKMVQFLSSRQVDGYIIAPTVNSQHIIKTLQDGGSPVVLIDRYFEELKTQNVITDNYGGMRNGCQFLKEKGCDHPLFINYASQMSNFIEREKGFIDTFGDNAIVRRVNYQNSEKEITDIMLDLSSQNYTFDSMVFATNYLAIKSISAMSRNHIYSNNEMHLLCFDQFELFELLPVPLSFISQPIEQMGQIAAQKILEMIEKGDEFVISDVKLDCTLHENE